MLFRSLCRADEKFTRMSTHFVGIGNLYLIMKSDLERPVYEISVEDLQAVANKVLGRELTDDEIRAVGNSVGDYIDWFQAIENAINNCIPS